MARWNVDRPGQGYNIEDVGADTLTVECGSLVFRTDDKPTVIYAPGQWTVVSEGVE